MGRKPPEAKKPDFSGVIQVIEHHLQYDSGSHPYESQEEAARAMESGDAWRLVVEIGEAMDRAKRVRPIA